MSDDEPRNEIRFCSFKLQARRVRVSDDELRNERRVRDKGMEG
jgi:hypothetical protein